MIRRADGFVFDVATRLSHWVQRTFGPTNFWLAKQALIVAGIGYAVDMADSLLGFWGADLPKWWLVFAPFIALMFVHDVKLCDHADAHYSKPTDVVYAPEFWFMPPAWLRVTFVAIYLLATVAGGPNSRSMAEFVFDRVSLSALLAWYYVARVTPLPPGESRVAKWWRKCKAAGSLQPVTTDR